MANGAYCISGLTEEGRKATTLTVPLGYADYKVTAIGAGAFRGSAVKELIVTEDTNLRNFFNDSFIDCQVTDVLIYYDFTNEEDKLAPASYFYGVRIHIPSGSAYSTHYDWLDSSEGYEFVFDLVK